MQRRDVLTAAALAAPALALAAAASASPKHPRPAMIETADGAHLAYSDWGTGKPVVFIHSWGVNSEMWGYQVADLLDHGVRCVTYDRRGHGRSADPGRGYDPDTLADDLAAVMDTLDLRDATLVGHSMGGGEIARYLSRHGDARVAGVVLLASTTPFLMKTADNPYGVDKALIDASRAVWRKDFPKWLADNTDPFFVADTSPAMKAWGVGMLLKTPLPILIECNRTVAQTDYRPDLRAIRKPVLILHGDKDASAILELTGKPSAALIPGAKLVVYEGAPHGLFVTHMDRVNSDIRAFIGV